jgi:hypothetical protein
MAAGKLDPAAPTPLDCIDPALSAGELRVAQESSTAQTGRFAGGSRIR